MFSAKRLKSTGICFAWAVLCVCFVQYAVTSTKSDFRDYFFVILDFGTRISCFVQSFCSERENIAFSRRGKRFACHGTKRTPHSIFCLIEVVGLISLSLTGNSSLHRAFFFLAWIWGGSILIQREKKGGGANYSYEGGN